MEDEIEPGGRTNKRRRKVDADRSNKVERSEAEGVSQGTGGLQRSLLRKIHDEFFANQYFMAWAVSLSLFASTE